MNAQPNFEDLLRRISAAAPNPDQMVSLMSDHRVTSEKFLRNAEQTQREFVVAAYAARLTAKAAGTLDAVIARAKALDQSIKSSCSYLVLLQAFISYGPNGAQYASCHKGVLNFLESRGIVPEGALKFIEDNGGLTNCYQIWLDDKYSGEAHKHRAKRTKAPNCVTPGIFPTYVQQEGDIAVALIRLKDARTGELELLKARQVAAPTTDSERADCQQAFEQIVGLLAVENVEGAPA